MTPASIETDQSLMARTADGDRMAFDALAGRYLLRLRRAALRVLGDTAAAEDVAQDALLRAWTRARTYDPAQASVSTWLHRIAVNAAIDRVRATRPSVSVPDDLLDGAPGADAVIAVRQRNRILAEAIATLPDRQRAAIALTYQHGRSGQEAARALQVSARALEGLLHRGRKLVRAYLEARDA
jgi:RNA polymerase sigma-70 factor (ECF subfamily)